MTKKSLGKLTEKAQRLRRFWAWSIVAKQLESYGCIYRSTGSVMGDDCPFSQRLKLKRPEAK